MNNTIKYIVFYDMTGKVYFTMSVDETPSGLEKFTFDVPEHHMITGVDVTDPSNPKIITEEDSSVDIYDEIKTLQEAITELYEIILNMEDK